ncbi:MAG: site-2 protease family protein [Candidatus Yanofskybacteria bacterium]|nr:site-2 protease family protein [Candidatus Yanofskybacteria bacterium]
MITGLIFIAVIGVLVLVHEWGHFVMARRAGMKVEEFGFGFPPRLFGIKKGETIYSINWIPFGGFVRILGEDGGQLDKLGSFGSKSISARLKVVVAGVVMNLIFAVLLLVSGNFFGLRIGLFDEEMIATARDKKVQILQVAPESPAERAGLQILDEIVGLQSAGGAIQYVTTTEEVQKFTSEHVGEKLGVILRHGNGLVTKEVETRLNPPPGEGSIGIVMALTGVVSYPWYEAIWRGVNDTAILTYNTMYGYYSLIKTLFIDGRLIGEVSGPIGIAGITGQAARVGFSYLMQFVALISINLAVLNILPFPALDGGRAVFIVAEKLRGRPLDKKIEAAVNGIGFALLVGLMIYVTIKDITKFFTV